MRKNLIFLLLIPIVFGCNPTPREGVLITGIIDNFEKELFMMGGPGGSRDTVLLDETGAFTYEVSNLDKGEMRYMILDQDLVNLWIANGMEMDFYADANNLKESMSFTGPGADINNYYASKNARAYDYNWATLGEEEYRFKADSVLAVQQGNLNIAEKDNPDEPFWKTEEADILFGWAGNLNTYPSMHAYYAKLPDYEAPESWYNFKSQLDINNPDYAGSRAFESYVSSLVRDKVGEKISIIMEADSTAEVDRHLMSLETGVEMIKNEKVLNKYLTSTMTGAMAYYDFDLLKDAMEFYKSKVSDEESLEAFNQEYEAWSKLAKGQPMFDFVGKDLEGNTVNSKDFRGKYLYVDVWATWCSPCKYEIPFLKTLEADYHDRNIVFLSYSIDEDKDAWLKFVPEEELGGVQIIGENAWQSQLCLDYKVGGVPTFMFFDPEGKIINVKMTRPSNQATRDSFDSYSDL